MIREKLTADSANVFLGLSANHGGVFQYRDGTGERTEMESRAEMFVPYWLRLKRHENEFTASASRNGTHWVRCERVALPMSEHVWIGLAAAAGQEQIAGIATMDNVAQDVMRGGATLVRLLMEVENGGSERHKTGNRKSS